MSVKKNIQRRRCTPRTIRSALGLTSATRHLQGQLTTIDIVDPGNLGEQRLLPVGSSSTTEISLDQEIVCNVNAGIVHLVDSDVDVSRCGWAFAPSQPTLARYVFQRGSRTWFVCGRCFGKKVPLSQVLVPETSMSSPSSTDDGLCNGSRIAVVLHDEDSTPAMVAS